MTRRERDRTLDGGETRIVPAGNDAVVNEPLQLALGQEGVGEVDTTKVLDLDITEARDVLEELRGGVRGGKREEDARRREAGKGGVLRLSE